MSSPKLYTLFFFFFLLSTHASFSQETIFAKDYGLIPNSFVDQSENMQKALEACKKSSAKKLILEKGRYDFFPISASKRILFISNTASEVEWPDKTKHIGLLIEDQNNLTIEGNQSEFVFHGKMTPFAIIRSSNIRIDGINTNFERPTMSELQILSSSDSEIIANVHPSSKYSIQNGKVLWYGEGWYNTPELHTILSDTVQGINQYSSFKPFQEANAEELGVNRLRFTGKFDPQKYPVGGILSMRNTIRDEVGGFVYRSKNIELSDLNIHYMHGLGITSQFSENLTYKNINITPSKGRAITSFADGMHFSGCKGKILIDNCHYKGLHDDPVNIHGTYLQIVEKINDKELLLEFKHHQSFGFDAFLPGDTIGVVSQEAIQPMGKLIVEKVETISPRKIKITFQGKLNSKVKIGDAVENLTWTPEVMVKNSRFEGTNARGILVTTPKKVIIENNTFFRTGMHGVLIAADVNSWFESGAVSDVTIRDNRFIDCGYNLSSNNYAIAILPENKKIVNGHFVHRNICIENNSFETFSPNILIANSTQGLKFIKNRINIDENKPAFETFRNNSGKFIVLNDVKDVIIKDNQSNKSDIYIELSNSNKKEISTDFKTTVVTK